MPMLPDTLDLADPQIDTTRDYCGNSLFIEEARNDYTRAYSRAMEYAFSEQLPGDVMEFGTYSGFTARILAETMVKYRHPGNLMLFDTFGGFPASCNKEDNESLKVSVQGYWREGNLNVPPGLEHHIGQRLTPVIGSDRLQIYKGMFEDTLRPTIQNRKAAIVHIDCDLYASAKYVLETLYMNGCLQDGTVLLFDDYYCNRANPHFGEQAALQIFLAMQHRYTATPWFTYSWGSAAFFLHDVTVRNQSNQTISGT
jgi:hypothetical protein